MAPYSKTTFTSGVTPASAAELNKIGDGIIEAQRQPFLTALPSATTGGPGGGALVDGQECYYKPDPTNATGNGNVVWHLKYELSSAKWYCIGGAPMIVKQVSADTTTSLNVYADPTPNAGPSVTGPLAGDFDVTYTVSMAHSAVAGFTVANVKVGAAAIANDDDSLYTQSATAGQQSISTRTIRKTIAAGDVLKVMYYVTPAGTGTVKRRSIAIMPVRVG
jgi:hypothetical protein